MDFLDVLSTLPPPAAFRSSEPVREALRQACREAGAVARFETIGESEEGRPIDAVTLGTGPLAIGLVAGHHADEPVGPETLRTLVVEGLRRRDELAPLWARARLVVVPHVNPDGEARNRRWISQWPDVASYITGAIRELPGRDLEFGYPDLRPENRAVSAFLARHGPYALYGSLHGMGFSEGAMLLIDRRWGYRTVELQAGFAAAAADAGLPLHDHNRRGEKGFFYLGPGFATTPEGSAMRAFFEAAGDAETARGFRASSMDFVRALGGDPLCIVTELPLFRLPRTGEQQPGVPATYLAFRDALPELRFRLGRGENVSTELHDFDPQPVDLATAVRLHLRTLAHALGEVL